MPFSRAISGMLTALAGLRFSPFGQMLREFQNSETCTTNGAWCFSGTNDKPEGASYDTIGVLDPNGDQNFSIYDVDTHMGG
mmetsp:Transcript_42826/g.99463  ORF Transcript_42826/g.99463 Transcript_42826/m.99463 type:complete len:81 (-) Transcript_42826:275-517(-)